MSRFERFGGVAFETRKGAPPLATGSTNIRPDLGTGLRLRGFPLDKREYLEKTVLNDAPHRWFLSANIVRRRYAHQSVSGHQRTRYEPRRNGSTGAVVQLDERAAR
ncbi:MAG: hypothetical protein VBE63_18855 [Lamprobacter sp.]|uniref:hypothetical protein n=1 Tax=Lamprobacter sp. TaxID=3100796 RepID=UPI002B25F0E0|nr:hypothetical protein [Lamprobacter sp.]MEA3641977.1 hypothetical protein [Lamprobacter sp.]